MKKHFTRIALMAGLLAVATSCKDDNTTPGGEPVVPPADEKVEFVSTTIPESLPWGGGAYRIVVSTEAESWQLKTVTRENPQGTVTEHKEKTASVVVPKNLSEAEQALSFEIFSDGKWEKACATTQQPGAVRLGETVWLKGNIALEQAAGAQKEAATADYRFTAGSETDFGLYFKHRSTYGVLSAGASYSGTAYHPEPASMALADIPEKEGDPCALVGQAGQWRLPSIAELKELFGLYDEDQKTENGIPCYSFDGGKLLLPLAGSCSADGTIGFQKTNGGYWGSGEDIDGNGSIFAFSVDYMFVDYATTGALASVRCVKNTEAAVYVSHTPKEIQTYEAFELAVTTRGTLAEYPVTVVSGELELTQMAGKDKPTVTFDIPANDGYEDRVFKIFVNEDNTGQTITQPYKAGYAVYVSHSPEDKVSGDAFKLTVTCKSDLDEFPVQVKGDGIDQTKTGGKTSPVVEFDIPANTGAEARRIEILVNGVSTEKAVTQESKYTDVTIGQTVWAKGNLTVKDNRFEIGAPMDYGYYFKFNSRYGIPSDDEAMNYEGTAYNPNPVTIDWKGIVSDNGEDPCRLVAPADSWRLPTKAEIESLNGAAGDAYTLNGVLGQNYADGKLFIPAAGILYDKNNVGIGSYIGRGEFGYVWSSTLPYALSFEEATCQVFNISPDYAVSVRCVRNTNYAFYVSHTPTAAQGPEAFTLSVTSRSDMAEFSVQVKGGDVNLTAKASKANPTATFEIPENASKEDRMLKIYVNGIYSGKSVGQAKQESTEPEGFAWAEGNIVLKEGKFAIGAPTDMGLFFRFRSHYGISAEGAAYGGTAYTPAEEQVAWAEIPYNDSDPCAMIAPANTWRLPTKAEFLELIKSYEVTTVDGVAGMAFDGGKYFFPAAGYRKEADGSLAAQGRYWTSDEGTGGKASFLGFATTAVAKPNANMNFGQKNGFSVRCVRGH